MLLGDRLVEEFAERGLDKEDNELVLATKVLLYSVLVGNRFKSGAFKEGEAIDLCFTSEEYDSSNFTYNVFMIAGLCTNELAEVYTLKTGIDKVFKRIFAFLIVEGYEFAQ